MNFRPNGRFAMSLNTNTGTGNGADAGDGEEEDECCLIFDGEKGNMKIAGGPESAFGLYVRPMVREWVERRGCVPGLMASILLSRVEEGTVAF